MNRLNKTLLLGIPLAWTAFTGSLTALADDSAPVADKPCPLAGGPGFGTAMGRPSCPTLDYAIRLCGTIYDTAHAIGGDPTHHAIKIWPQDLTLQGADAEIQASLDGIVLRLGCVFGDKLPQSGLSFVARKLDLVKF